MAQDLALLLANQLKSNFAQLARAIVEALKDKNVSGAEWLGIGVKGQMAAMALFAAIKATDYETQQEMLWIAEHGEWTMPQPTPGAEHTEGGA